ncbi:cation diffusion facilitator family transporter [Nocardioides jiangxiensis]|uniref:Cation diffusion facilitator family transporter n=1 Tax=Nocardioides jiangxiensis TaxID=3064524 RepID=A0ABT9AYC4_9ACTN|nr:cation diffusion facilitator family transporter [Nocardioides sp. WY-20]MDO7867576.1 cation diffusion facilitator family transporter [Nocardioides sp. WY-20]
MSGDHDHAGHQHGVSADADRRLLWASMALLATFMVGEVAVALASGSLALLSDAAHMLSDVGAIAAALWAMRLAARPASVVWTYGFKRAEILTAAINGITLLVVAGMLAVEAVRRLVDPPEVAGGPVLVVALAGCAVNVLAVWLLARANRSSLNVEGAYQHILTDLYGFIGTAVAGLVILWTGWTPADTIATLVVVGLMLHAAWGLLKQSGRVLLEGAPEHVDLDAVRSCLLEVEHIVEVHDLHAWTITSDLPALTAHLVVEDGCFRDGHAGELLEEVQSRLQQRFDVEHSTFQIEPRHHAATEHGMH